MTVTLDKSHELKGNGYLLGVGGENESEQLIINIAYDVLLDKWAYIEFEQIGAKHTTERLTIANGQILYSIPNGLLVTGHTSVQVIFRDANGFVWKSFKRQFLVSDEINATENYPQSYPDFITEAQKLLDEITVESAKVDEVLATEEARVAAEAQRAENEATRLAKETERETTEAERKTAETARITAENERQINEAGRVDAETARRTEFSGWANSLGNLNTYDKRLINLEEAGVGTLFDYVTDDTEAFIKTVPAKALPYARLNKVGGMTYKANNALTDTPVKSVGGYAIPEAIQLLDGYGLGIDDTCYNYIDFERKKYVKALNTMVLNGTQQGALNATFTNETNVTVTYIISDAKYFGKSKNAIIGTANINIDNEAIGFSHNNVLYVKLLVSRVGGNTIDAIKQYLIKNPITVLYELATPIETDISAYITDNYIKVEPNGTVVFENDAAAAVPSEIIYAVKR